VVSLHVLARGPDSVQAQASAEQAVAQCRLVLGPHVFGEGDETLVSATARLLLGRNPIPIVATAESCTGGFLARCLSDEPGSSAFFRQGWVCYANEAKVEQLGVDPKLLATEGAVSEAVAKAMAEGARTRARADLALATTGIAGPSGGTEAKPVGTVCFALATASGTRTWTRRLPGDRALVRELATRTALDALRRHLLAGAEP
jgi:nicotinamide-nucleotide amidase